MALWRTLHWVALLVACLLLHHSALADEAAAGLRSQALEALDAGQYDTSISLLHQALAQDKHDADTWSDLGVALLRKEKIGAARDCFQRALSLKKRHEDARTNLEELNLFLADQGLEPATIAGLSIYVDSEQFGTKGVSFTDELPGAKTARARRRAREARRARGQRLPEDDAEEAEDEAAASVVDPPVGGTPTPKATKAAKAGGKGKSGTATPPPRRRRDEDEDDGEATEAAVVDDDLDDEAILGDTLSRLNAKAKADSAAAAAGKAAEGANKPTPDPALRKRRSVANEEELEAAAEAAAAAASPPPSEPGALPPEPDYDSLISDDEKKAAGDGGGKASFDPLSAPTEDEVEAALSGPPVPPPDAQPPVVATPTEDPVARREREARELRELEEAAARLDAARQEELRQAALSRRREKEEKERQRAQDALRKVREDAARRKRHADIAARTAPRSEEEVRRAEGTGMKHPGAAAGMRDGGGNSDVALGSGRGGEDDGGGNAPPGQRDPDEARREDERIAREEAAAEARAKGPGAKGKGGKGSGKRAGVPTKKPSKGKGGPTTGKPGRGAGGGQRYDDPMNRGSRSKPSELEAEWEDDLLAGWADDDDDELFEEAAGGRGGKRKGSKEKETATGKGGNSKGNAAGSAAKSTSSKETNSSGSAAKGGAKEGSSGTAASKGGSKEGSGKRSGGRGGAATPTATPTPTPAPAKAKPAQDKERSGAARTQPTPPPAASAPPSPHPRPTLPPPGAVPDRSPPPHMQPTPPPTASPAPQKQAVSGVEPGECGAPDPNDPPIGNPADLWGLEEDEQEEEEEADDDDTKVRAPPKPDDPPVPPPGSEAATKASRRHTRNNYHDAKGREKFLAAGRPYKHYVEPITRVPLVDFFHPHFADLVKGRRAFILTNITDGAPETWADRLTGDKLNLEWMVATFRSSSSNSLFHDRYLADASGIGAKPMSISDGAETMRRRIETARLAASRKAMQRGASQAEVEAALSRAAPKEHYLMWYQDPLDAILWEAHTMGELPWAPFRMDLPWLEDAFHYAQDRVDSPGAAHTALHMWFRETIWRMVTVGTTGAGMMNHYDGVGAGSWQVQLRGSKTWHVCDPRESSKVGPAGSVDVLRNPDYKMFPQLRSARCQVGTVHEGEAIFYPFHTWHQTENGPGVSIAYSSGVLQPQFYVNVFSHILNGCESLDRRVPMENQGDFSLMLCVYMRGRAVPWWEEAYGGRLQFSERYPLPWAPPRHVNASVIIRPADVAGTPARPLRTTEEEELFANLPEPSIYLPDISGPKKAPAGGSHGFSEGGVDEEDKEVDAPVGSETNEAAASADQPQAAGQEKDERPVPAPIISPHRQWGGMTDPAAHWLSKPVCADFQPWLKKVGSYRDAPIEVFGPVDFLPVKTVMAYIRHECMGADKEAGLGTLVATCLADPEYQGLPPRVREPPDMDEQMHGRNRMPLLEADPESKRVDLPADSANPIPEGFEDMEGGGRQRHPQHRRVQVGKPPDCAASASASSARKNPGEGGSSTAPDEPAELQDEEDYSSAVL